MVASRWRGTKPVDERGRRCDTGHNPADRLKSLDLRRRPGGACSQSRAYTPLLRARYRFVALRPKPMSFAILLRTTAYSGATIG